MTWTDDTEANYRKWHKEHYGVEAPELKFPKKEVKMTAGDQNEEKTLTEAVEIGKAQIREINTNPAIATWGNTKRHRRPKGTAPGIEIITTRTAIIPLHIPERPKEVEKVFLRITQSAGIPGIIEIEWPEGVTALDAITAYLIRPAR